MSSRCMFCDAMKDTDAEMVCLSCFDDMVNGKDDLVSRLQEENDFLLKRVEELESHLCPACGNM